MVYHELIQTSKEYMSTVTAVDAEWLAELGPMFFSIKESYAQRMETRKLLKSQKTSVRARETAVSCPPPPPLPPRWLLPACRRAAPTPTPVSTLISRP